jgi:hypothetical protein
VAGNPKMPLPMMEFTASAAKLQRPIARTKPVFDVVIENPFVSYPRAHLN